MASLIVTVCDNCKVREDGGMRLGRLQEWLRFQSSHAAFDLCELCSNKLAEAFPNLVSALRHAAAPNVK